MRVEPPVDSTIANVILFLLGLVQAWFFFDKHRTDSELKDLRDKIDAAQSISSELKELRESYRETRKSIQRMEGILTSLEKQIAVANYALFKERVGDPNE
jgi:septal ring factor EnvC (AmiA/AmiB activator)